MSHPTGKTVAQDRATRLREKEIDAWRAVQRLARLLQRQLTRRKRLNKAIAHNRKRLKLAAEALVEASRVLVVHLSGSPD